MTWQSRAACANTDPAVFFPSPGANADLAKAICRRCPVRQECGDGAIARGEQFGVWGGKSIGELKAARRDPVTGQLRRQCAACDDFAIGLSPHCDACRRRRRAAIVRRYDQKRRVSA